MAYHELPPPRPAIRSYSKDTVFDPLPFVVTFGEGGAFEEIESDKSGWQSGAYYKCWLCDRLFTCEQGNWGHSSVCVVCGKRRCHECNVSLHYLCDWFRVSDLGFSCYAMARSNSRGETTTSTSCKEGTRTVAYRRVGQ